MSDPAPALPGSLVTSSPEAPLEASAMDREADDEPGDPGSGPPADVAPDSGPAGPTTGVPVPGAYTPPSTVRRPPEVTAPPQMPLAASPTVGTPPPAPSTAWTPPAPVASPAPPAPPGRASLFADLPFDAPDTLTEWLVAVGSGVAAVSFLLPWISGTTSYVTSWGLGAASRLPILAVLVVTAVLGVLPNRVALWVRAGVLGLIGGSIFLGNLWPIVAGDFGDAAFGAIVGAAAAIVLIVGGILGVAPRRPAADAG